MTPRCPKCGEPTDVELTLGGMWHCVRCRAAWEPRVVRVVSFGFKHGIPVLHRAADRVIDVRQALYNPWGMPALRGKSYPDPAVVAFVEADPAFGAVVQDIVQAAQELAQDGTGGAVYVGCTGGQHRSPVVVAAGARVAAAARTDAGKVVALHRDAAGVWGGR